MEYSEIRKKRLEYKLSQTKLAESTGLSKARISALELGKIPPLQSDIILLNETLDKLISDIKSGKDIRKKRIQHKGEKRGKLPPIIKNADLYAKKMEAVKYNSEYANRLSELYRMAINEKKDSAIKGIALFSGCGGMSLGFQAAGINLVGHVEINDSANEIYEANFSNSELLKKDINDVEEKDIEHWMQKYGNIDIIVGGPPCQGFSLAGKRNPNDTRNKLYKQYVRIVHKIRPKVFVLENVALMTSMKMSNGELFIDNIVAEFKDIGYTLTKKIVNACDYGVPQSRERVIVIGVRDDLKKKFAFDTIVNEAHSTNENIQDSLFSNPIKNIDSNTFRYATSDLKLLENGEADSVDPLHWAIFHPQHVIKWLKDVPEGHSAHENKDPNLRPPSGFNTTYKRICWDEPCSTISTNFSMISGCRNVHPCNTRSLTIREATRAQSFPDQFVFLGKWGDVRKAIGNAVPPLLAFKIALEIKNKILI